MTHKESLSFYTVPESKIWMHIAKKFSLKTLISLPDTYTRMKFFKLKMI